MEQKGTIVFCNLFSKNSIQEIIQNQEAQNYKFIVGMTSTSNIKNGILTSEPSKLSIPLKDVEFLVTEATEFNKEQAVSAAKHLKNFKPKIIIAFISDPSGRTEDFFKYFNSIYHNAPIVGGLASKPDDEDKTFVFSQNKILSSGIIFLALKGDIKVKTGYAFGWTHFKKKFKITKCYKNKIYEIENRPVTDFFSHYLGKSALYNLEVVTISFPLMVRRNGKLVARACIGIDDDGSMIFSGNFRENEFAYFGVGSERKIISEARKLWWEMAKFFPDRLLLFPCMVRKAFLGKKFHLETSLFSSICENAGGLTFGEVLTLNRKPILLNQTLTAVGLKFPSYKRKKQEIKIHVGQSSTDTNDDKIHPVIIEMLVHLANTVMRELEEKNRKIKILAETDSLTGLYNRRKIFERLEEEIARCERYGNPLSVIIFDIDFFKKVNDTYGHLIGDKVLKEIAKILKSNTRKPDIAGRYGGEEFIIILPHTDTEGAIKLAEKIRKLIENHNFGIGRKITISAGVTSYIPRDTVDSLISRADQALYKAKAEGRSRVCSL
ncbi:sensor domain-containing diguanylate cyclase [Desulfurobacterium atlanticum]|uniref:diguanylate cyclase n=1 Tax=Desulfurobacterium atlanticum TaxID=240169 RepID=A0A238ZWD3_9BACT|nr:diguanylate cyclase [Desulfurobacterium atlanticum]SNR87198.1 diguanylate cyclase (GGDEF) domain-containing protein [Desulfurobacterium atlanticum]